jgi:methylenetetrahydrofolate dehydrogenase (NADP+)/methenyltetrahydrofolate cyclohydrolase
MLRFYGIATSGKHCVVVGRSNIVGSPMSILMSRNADPGNCTVTLAHSRTVDLPSITRQADILIVAIGKPGFVTADMVKEGAVVVDVGIHRVADKSRSKGYRIVGDVDFASVAPKCTAITPVPGGVGADDGCQFAAEHVEGRAVISARSMCGSVNFNMPE